MKEKRAVKAMNALLHQNAILKEKNKQLEDMIQSVGEKKRVRSKEMSKMSHDVRTPMNAIVGFTSIAREEKGNPQKTQECLKRIEEATLCLLSLVDEFAVEQEEKAGQEEAAQEQFSLLQVLDEVEKAFWKRPNENRISFELDKTELKDDVMTGSRQLVKQVLLGLLNNAFWLSGKNGIIKLCVKTLAGDMDNTVIGFRMTDNRAGYNHTFIDQTFLPFEEENELARQEPQDTALMTINNLVSLLNGIVRIEGDVGKKTIIKVELPFRLEHTRQQDLSQIKAESKDLFVEDYRQAKYLFSGQHILLAEDNYLNSEIMETYLIQANLQVDTAVNGQIAFDYFVNSEEGSYSAILMDIRMPVMDGREVTRKIRSLSRSDAGKIPIIAMSADAFSEEIKYSQSIGMNEYLTKPIFKEVLFQMLTKYINT